MKNKLFLFSLSLIVLLTGCNNENDASSSADGSSMASFRLELPGETTRAASDTYTPTRYIMEVYPDKTATGIPLMHIEQDNGTFDVSLTYGTTYTCLFWADNGTPDNVVNDEYETADLKAVKAKADIPPTNPAYGGMAQVTAGISSSADYSVKLKHAVAKVSYIQDQRPFTSAGNTLTVTFPKTCQLNVSDWSVNEIADATTTHTFTGIGQVAAGDRLATSYVIAPSATADMQNITVTLNQEPPKAISNVPLRRNYNTNITGAYSDLYNSDMTCNITEAWDTPESEEDLISIWDGTTVTEPADYSADAPSEVEITSAAELAWLAEQSNAVNRKTFSGYTFKLTTDIDLKKHLWQQIGHNKSGFKGTLDGGGHAVHGVNVTNNNNGSAEQYAGFIYKLTDGKIKNITVRGYINCSSPSNMFPSMAFGGIAGYASHATLENCNNACMIKSPAADGCTGGIAGYAENSVIKGCINYGTITTTEGYVCIGGIVGLSKTSATTTATSTLDNNINKGTVTYQCNKNGGYLGGIVGKVWNEGAMSLNNNMNNGEVSCTFGKHGAPNCMGGIIGQLLALSSGTGTTITGNVNNGSITSEYSKYEKMGGIIGLAQAQTGHTVTLTKNTTERGQPANIIIGLCQLNNGTMTVDDNTVTDDKPYPYSE